MKKIFIFLPVLLFFSSCYKCRDLKDIKWFEAKVIEIKNMDCGYPLIQFAESEEVEKILGSSPYPGAYVMKGLDASLNFLNNEILIQIRKPSDNESWFCTTLGPSYGSGIIINAKSK
jgi:hypothetical protein